jgi:uncharacterized protein
MLLVELEGYTGRPDDAIEHAQQAEQLYQRLIDDPLSAVRQAGPGFQNIPVERKEGCGSCVWRYVCGGGCPLLTWRTTGRADLRSPYCQAYRTLFPKLLRLEGLRILKWQGRARD